MAPDSNTSKTNSSSSRLLTQLQETTAATLKLQQSLQPYMKVLRHETDPHHSTTPDHDNLYDTSTDRIASSTLDQHRTVVAKTVVALTLATICYLKPHLQRTSKSKPTTTITTTASQKKVTQQIRSDLNQIRQLLKKVQECHKRKETSTSQQQQVSELSSKRIKRK